ncbi:hypothetical protein [Aquimarina agarilytica]|uniref:hypothetical protein n=1 Tax=Aquimarina agarilytica TaxID=1087449 RepID=UPI0002892F78|nr:hypothetical protein [Aquimarina agarilytica]
MKKFKLYSLVVVLLFSCTTRDDFKVPEGAVASPFIITGIVESDDRTLKSRIGFDVEFLDGTIDSDSREWIFPEGSVDFIEGTNTSEKIIVKFLKEGELDVVLKSGGKETLEKLQILGKVEGTIKSEPTDPEATGFVFDVASKIFVIEAGTEVQFTEETTGELEKFAWKFPGQTPAFSSEKNPVITFNNIGEFKFNFRGTSALPFGDLKIPFFPQNGEETFFEYKVIPSSKPLEFKSLTENENAEIVISFSRALDPETLEGLGNFNVKVGGVEVPLESVMVSESSPQSVLLKPVTDIKNSQMATLSYEITTLSSTDGVNAVSESFMDKEVMLYDPNLIEKDISFEGGVLEWEIGTPGNNAADVVLGLVSPGNDSDSALSVSGFKQGNNFTVGLADALNVKEGQRLELSFDYKIPADFAGTTQVTFRLYEDGKFSDMFKAFNNVNCCGLKADGEWNTLTKELSNKISGDFRSGVYIQLISQDANPSSILIDNIAIRIIE